MTSGRVPTLILASCAAATTLAATARLLVLGQRFGIVDPHQHGVGVDILAAHDGHLSDAAVDPRGMSNRVASTSPCTSRGSPRTRNQMDSAATAAMTTATIMNGMRSAAGARGCGFAGGTSGAGGIATLADAAS